MILAHGSRLWPVDGIQRTPLPLNSLGLSSSICLKVEQTHAWTKVGLRIGGIQTKGKRHGKEVLGLNHQHLCRIAKNDAAVSFTFYELYTLLCVLIGCAEVFKLLATQSEMLGIGFVY